MALLLAEGVLRVLGQRPYFVNPDRVKFWMHDSRLGWRLRPGQSGVLEKPQFRIQVDINADGLRDREYSRERVPGVRRMVVLGDSYVWGFGVEQNEIFTEKLESSLPDLEVINAGVSAYSTDQELLWLQSPGMGYSPDLVLLVVTGNDDHDNAQRLTCGIYYKPKFVITDDGLELTNVPVPRASMPRRTAYWLGQRTALFGLVGRTRYTLIGAMRDRARRATANARAAPADKDGAAPQTFRPPEERFALTLALIEEMRRTAEGGGARFAVMIHGFLWVRAYHGTYPEMVETLRRAGYPLLVVEEIPGYEREKLAIPRDGHWNAAGHELVARALERFILEEELLPTAQ